MLDLKKIFEAAGIQINVGEISDGFHTFNSLYHQRLILFAVLCNTFVDISWKSKKHSDGKVPFGGGWFIVGIDTPEGQYTYHYELKDWDLFKCKELEKAPVWDGHTDKDVERLLSLYRKEKTMCKFCEKIYPLSKGGLLNKNLIAYDETLDHFDIWAVIADPYDSGVIEDVKYCPYCGRELKGENNEP